MPKKACCCQKPPQGTRSCCRPIYQGCVGNEYAFSLEFTASMPCYKREPVAGLEDAEYTCQSNPAITHNITGSPETFLLTVYHTIQEPVALWDVAYYSYVDQPWLGSGTNYGCAGSGFDPNDPSTYHEARVGSECDTFGGLDCYSCLDCECQKNPLYSYCNFDESQLRPNCDLVPPNGLSFLWNTCYKAYHLQKITRDFTSVDQYPPQYPSCYTGCTFTPPDRNIRNLPDSFTFQFVPNPDYPEQMEEDYVPKLQPDLEYFYYNCRGKDQVIADPSRPLDGSLDYTSYRIQLSITIGYEKTFNCSLDTENPVYETLSLPFFYYETFFGFGTAFQGMRIEGTYDRNTLEDDPMDMCVPPSTYTEPHTSCPNLLSNPCLDPGIQYYKDDYTICALPDGSAVGSVGDENFQWFPEPGDPIYTYDQYCPEPTFGVYNCRHFQVPANITTELL